LRVDGTGGVSGSVASVDSELTLLYRKMTGAEVPSVGRIDNPYYLGDKPIASAKRFTRDTSDLYLVTRLDGFSVEDVLRLIDRGADHSGVGVVARLARRLYSGRVFLSADAVPQLAGLRDRRSALCTVLERADSIQPNLQVH